MCQVPKFDDQKELRLKNSRIIKEESSDQQSDTDQNTDDQEWNKIDKD